MKNNNGFTLLEVLVSIIIVGIIGFCVTRLFVSKAKIEKKSANIISVSEKVEFFFDDFTTDPLNFVSKHHFIYETSPNVFEGDYHVNANTILKLTYNIEHNNRTLIIYVYKNNELYKIKNHDYLKKTIKVGV